MPSLTLPASARRLLLAVLLCCVAGGAAMAATTIGGPFALTDAKTGQTVTNADLHGRWLLLYFGYTFCPDVCPTDLQKVIQARGGLGPEEKDLTPVFITVDPARDTVAVMARYVALFSPDLLGLTGSPAAIGQVVREFRVYVAKQPLPGGGGGYLINHSTFLYLIDPQGRLATILPSTLSTAALTRRLRRAMRAAGEG